MKLRSGLLLSAVSLLIAAVAVEVLLRVIRPLPDPYAYVKRIPGVHAPASPYVPSAFPPRMRLVVRAEPGLPGVDERPRRFTVNNLGYRGDSLATPKPAGEVRVFMVGGSTTECYFLDDAEAVTAVLQRRLNEGAGGGRVKVYGAGKSGDRSWDHVAMTAHRIAHLQPDVVIVFAGINDLMAGIGGRDYLLMRGAGGPDRGRMGIGMGLKLMATEFQIPRLAHSALAPRAAEEVRTVSNYRSAVRRQAAFPADTGAPPVNVGPYAENLATLAAVAQAHGARVVFITQATTWNASDPRAAAWHWMTGPDRRYAEARLDAAMEAYNDATRRVAAARGAPVFDLARVLPKSMDFFYDDIHFNVRGAEAAGTLLARFMIEQGIITF